MRCVELGNMYKHTHIFITSTWSPPCEMQLAVSSQNQCIVQVKWRRCCPWSGFPSHNAGGNLGFTRSPWNPMDLPQVGLICKCDLEIGVSKSQQANKDGLPQIQSVSVYYSSTSTISLLRNSSGELRRFETCQRGRKREHYQRGHSSGQPIYYWPFAHGAP